MSGISCAARIKHSLPECELNLVAPVSLAAPPSSNGPAGKRYAAGLPDPEFLPSRDIAVLEAQTITPDLARREIVLGSSRGNLAIRYTDLVVEVPAIVRLPRALQKAENVYGWPAPGFTANPDALDAALSLAKETERAVVVTGKGLAALDAVFLVREAGLKAVWLRTGEKGTPDMEPHLLALALKRLGPEVECIRLPDLEPGQLVRGLNSAGNRLESIAWPGGVLSDIACCLWTSPLMARHPLLREDGVFLDAFGRIEAPEAGSDLRIMGGGAALPAALLAGGSLQAPVYPGGDEAAGLSAALTLDRLVDPENTHPAPFRGALGAQSAFTPGLCLCRAGFTLAEAQAMGLEADQAVASHLFENGSQAPYRLVAALTGDKATRTLVGLQVLGFGAKAPPAEDLFSLGLTAMADGTSLESLMQREWSGPSARLLGKAARFLAGKFDTVTQGISPDELLASRAAGAEFFTLDLRPHSEWAEGHLPGAYNIPVIQLKKRLQDEVPRFTPLVLVCATGDESHAVASRLAALGATDLYVLDGGMDLWPYSLEKQ